MKNHDGKFDVDQKLFYRVGDIDLPVTFLSLGPRMGKGSVIRDAETAIVQDANGNMITVKLADLRPA